MEPVQGFARQNPTRDPGPGLGACFAPYPCRRVRVVDLGAVGSR
jgi:hypothetical protein